MVVCRPEDEAGPLLGQLRRLGASTVAVPLHRLAAPADGGAALAAAVADLCRGRYHWLAVTSANGVRALLPHLGGPIPDSTRVAAVGPATAAAFAEAGIRVDLVPPTATARDLANAFPPASPGQRVLAPLNEAAATTLGDGLEARGYTVDRVDAYRMVRTDRCDDTTPGGRSGEEDVRGLVSRADAVLLTAPSQVEAFVDRFGIEATPPVVACIGPRTAAKAAEVGLAPIEPPAHHHLAGLIETLVASLEGAADVEAGRAPEIDHAPEKRNP